MSGEKHGKLNQLQREIPEGLVVTAAWLSAHGYSAQLCTKYVTNGWLDRLTQGVYRRPSGRLVWEQIAISLQTLLNSPVVVGGETALALQGFAHNVTREEKAVHLYGPRPSPAWLNKLGLPTQFQHHNTTTIFRNESLATLVTNLRWSADAEGSSSRAQGDFVAIPWGQSSWPLSVSSPERAILEFLGGLPNHASFEQADKFMESLATLRPRRVQKLLSDCKSIKVKRLFLFFAERHHHAWFKHLDQTAIDLGAGKRMLAPGGRLDRHYLITVPEEFHGSA